jgi:hypothetical protein
VISRATVRFALVAEMGTAPSAVASEIPKPDMNRSPLKTNPSEDAIRHVARLFLVRSDLSGTATIRPSDVLALIFNSDGNRHQQQNIPQCINIG